MANVNECFKCGVSGEKVRLNDAISSKGIVKICSDCNAVERLPIIKRPSTEQIADSQRQMSVRNMLAGANKRPVGREVSLRELVDRNLKERLAKQPSDLIDNFQWVIQRVRRNRKITREQFAKGIDENESTVRMLESGILPNNDYRIISKAENFLGVTLKKKEGSKLSEPLQRSQFSRQLGFDRDSSARLKVADLRSMNKKQGGARKPVDSWEEETSQDDEKFLDELDEDMFKDED